VANDITVADSGFGSDNNQVTIIDREGEIDSLPLLPKREVADRILDRVVELLPPKKSPLKVVKCLPLTSRRIMEHILCFSRKDRQYFPRSGEELILITNIGEIKTRGRGKIFTISANLQRWFNANPGLSESSKVFLEIAEPMKRYRLKL